MPALEKDTQTNKNYSISHLKNSEERKKNAIKELNNKQCNAFIRIKYTVYIHVVMPPTAIHAQEAAIRCSICIGTACQERMHF